ncbi:DUF6710 family protein [Senegalia massiliensis]|uniref:Uncharacterized protein n=1 Tax=Senegalia massiliensis TaxID=1720316 RepID=A0A845QYK5_9CLOT|nr:DUF6710 family protein [Senegalia massiliensis]NBI07565.1 hypothetical protein [Senegalia massiliensis]
MFTNNLSQGKIKKKQFNNIIEFAKELISKNEVENYDHNGTGPQVHPIFNLIKLLGANIPIDYGAYIIKNNPKSLPRIDTEEFLFSIVSEVNKKGEIAYNLLNEIKTTADINANLNSDLILPWVWNRDRLLQSLSRIGENRLFDFWKEDKNHRLHLWLPMGIFWVEGGNHSILTGIIQGEGKIIPKKISDISDIYKYVKCDGKYFIRIEDNEIISKVQNVEFAAIFEIGRIMIEKNICYKNIVDYSNKV